MKSLILINVIFLTHLNLFSQAKVEVTEDCKSMKQDTLEADFLIEVNCNNLYYSSETVVFQKNLMFSDPQCIDICNAGLLYYNDSVFIYSYHYGIDYYMYKPCIDFNSVNDFQTKSSNLFLKKKNKSLYKKSIIKNKDGIEYLRFHATIVFFNIGEFEWNIPGIYCGINKRNEKNNQYCKRVFKNTLLLLKVLDFKYYAEYKLK